MAISEDMLHLEYISSIEGGGGKSKDERKRQQNVFPTPHSQFTLPPVLLSVHFPSRIGSIEKN